jgi:hypothetical protein
VTTATAARPEAEIVFSIEQERLVVKDVDYVLAGEEPTSPRKGTGQQ